MHRAAVKRSTIKDRVYKKIGGFHCELCGCDEPLLMMINYRNRDGAKHREEMKEQSPNKKYHTHQLYNRILDDPNPRLTYRPLCASCNWLARKLNDEEVRQVMCRDHLIQTR